MPSAVDEWFVSEVLPLEPALERFLRRHSVHCDDVADLRQEVYKRVYEAARRSRPTLTAPFVFMTARNFLRDQARRARIVSIDAVADLEALNISNDEVSADRAISAREELHRLIAALDLLPPRCREVVVLRKIEGLPQKEVARRMSITESTVEQQIAKGVRALAALLGNAAPAGGTAQTMLAGGRGAHE